MTYPHFYAPVFRGSGNLPVSSKKVFVVLEWLKGKQQGGVVVKHNLLGCRKKRPGPARLIWCNSATHVSFLCKDTSVLQVRSGCDE
jgi:hypothetical protein